MLAASAKAEPVERSDQSGNVPEGMLVDRSVAGGMLHEAAAMGGPSLVQSLLKSMQDKAHMRRSAHPPADDAASLSVDHEGRVDEA